MPHSDHSDPGLRPRSYFPVSGASGAGMGTPILVGEGTAVFPVVWFVVPQVHSWKAGLSSFSSPSFVKMWRFCFKANGCPKNIINEACSPTAFHVEVGIIHRFPLLVNTAALSLFRLQMSFFPASPSAYFHENSEKVIPLRPHLPLIAG